MIIVPNLVACPIIFILWTMLVKRSVQSYEKWSFFSAFSRLGLFPQVFRQVKKCLILQLNEMIIALTTCSCVPSCFYFVLWSIFIGWSARTYEKQSFFSIFSCFGLFTLVFEQVNEWPISKLHEIIRVLNAVACPIIFVLFDDPDWQGRVLKIMKNDHFLVFLAGRSAQTYEKCSFL